ncbi:MAG: putative Ig domain-containing protein, partial [Candidatus Acidiferrales bacterium]
VEPAVTIPATTLPAATITVPYTATVNATGGLAPYTWTLAPGSNPLPAWARLGTSATNSVTITGTPNAVGTTNFTLQITDSLGVTAISPALSLVVNAIPALQITTTTPLNPPAIAGTKYSLTFAATGGIAPYKWSVASGSTLPPNLSITNAGVLSGTPTTAGNPGFSITVTDSENPAISSTSAFTLLIQPAGTLQITSPATLPNAIVNQTYSTTLQASGGTPPYTWSLQAGSTLPAGLSLSSGGIISGTPTVAGPPANGFTILVTDSANPPGTAQTAFSLLVNTQAALSGSYAFEFNGYQIANVGGIPVNQRVTAAGSFVIGIGSAITGIEDYNTGGGQNHTGQSFTGQFTEAGGRGTLTLNGLTQGTTVYSFALDSTGTVGRLIETDSTTGARGSGEFAKQGATTCTDATLKGDYVFGLTGDSTAQNGASLFGPSVFAGRFTTDGVGGIFNGEADEHSPNQIIHINLGSLNGTYKQGNNRGYCTISMTAGTLTSNLNAYPVTTNSSGVITEAYLIAADPLNTTNFYILEGKLIQQPGSQLGAGPPFTGSGALDGASV